MNGVIETMKRKGKFSDRRPYAQYSLEQIEFEERMKVKFMYNRLDNMFERGEIDFNNPPGVWPVAFQKWILERFGLKRLAEYLRLHEYKDRPEGVRGRLEALGVSKDEIEAVMAGKELVKITVAGVAYGSRQKALERLTYYAPEEILTIMVPEPDNPFDGGAIAVKVFVKGSEKSYCIGYIPADKTSKIKPFIEKLPELKIVRSGLSYGAEIKLAV